MCLMSSSAQVSTAIFFTIIVFCNLFPDISHVDGAIVDRLRVINMERTALTKEALEEGTQQDSEDQFVPMKNAREYVQTTEFKNGMRWLMHDAYGAYLREGNNEPDAVKASTSQRVVETDVMETVGEHFEVWSEAESKRYINRQQANDAGWFTSNTDLMKRIKEAHPLLSCADVVRQITKAIPRVQVAEMRRNLAPRVKGLSGIRALPGGGGRGHRD